jgi:hypothetical protein
MFTVVHLTDVLEAPSTLQALEAVAAPVLVLSNAGVRYVPYEDEVKIVHQLHDMIFVAV